MRWGRKLIYGPDANGDAARRMSEDKCDLQPYGHRGVRAPKPGDTRQTALHLRAVVNPDPLEGSLAPVMVGTVGAFPTTACAGRTAMSLLRVKLFDKSQKAMDTMQTPVVNELSRMSAYRLGGLPCAELRGPQTWRPVRAFSRGPIDREPTRRPLPEDFTGGRT
jgi:hypothetical protein